MCAQCTHTIYKIHTHNSLHACYGIKYARSSEIEQCQQATTARHPYDKENCGLQSIVITYTHTHIMWMGKNCEKLLYFMVNMSIKYNMYKFHFISATIYFVCFCRRRPGNAPKNGNVFSLVLKNYSLCALSHKEIGNSF